EPDDTPLGSSIDGPAGDQPVHVGSSGSFDQCYQLSQIVTPVPGGGPGYNDTTNNGNEYKVWVCSQSNFAESSCKTDNFKVIPAPPPPPQDGALQILKFYDSDQDGVKDPGEAYLPNWQVDLSPAIGANPVLTSFSSVAAPGIYTATERDTIETNWFASTAKTLSTIVVVNDTSTIEFGNYCTLTPGGHTIGYWSNKNGQNEETAADFVDLNALHLRKADGSDQDFTSGTLATNKKNLNTWILGAK